MQKLFIEKGTLSLIYEEFLEINEMRKLINEKMTNDT